MSDDINATAVPHKLCKYCKNVSRQLLAHLSTGAEDALEVEHYPNMQAFIDSVFEEQCHFCAILAGDLRERNRTRTFEEALEKS